MRRLLATAALACLAALTGCADLPTTVRAPGGPEGLSANELTEEELAGLELLPLDFLTIDPSFPDGYHWFSYWTYQQMGITFKGGFLAGVYEFEATIPHAWRWRPDADIQSVYPYLATYFHELRFTPELGARIRRAEFALDNTGHVWNRPSESTYVTCYDRNGASLGTEEVNGRGDPSPVVSASVIGRDFGYCRTESKSGYAIVGMRLTLLPEQTAKPVLRCHGDLGQNRVTRGQTLRCEVQKSSATAPGDLAVSGWSFEGSPRTDGDVTSSVWEGQMVAAGAVAVRARTGTGTEQAASAKIEVVNRTWSAPTVTVQEIPNGAHPRLTLPSRIVLPEDLGRANFFFTAGPADFPLDPLLEVRGGPNNGLFYFGDLSFPIWAYYVLNRAAMSAGSPFYNAQDPNGRRAVPPGMLNWCDRGVVSASLPGLVEAHEREHIRVYQDVFRRELARRIGSLETMSGAEFDVLMAAFEAGRDQADSVARSASRAIHNLRGHPNVVTPRDSQGPCALRNENGQAL